jgi:hypothetical protein
VQRAIYTPRGGNGVLAQFECPIYIYIYGGTIATIFMCCVYAYFTDLSKSATAIPRGARGGEQTEKSKRLSAEYIIYIYIYYIICIYMYTGVVCVCANATAAACKHDPDRFIRTNCTHAMRVHRKTFTLGNLSLQARRIIIPWLYANPPTAFTHTHTRAHIRSNMCVCRRIKRIYIATVYILYIYNYPSFREFVVQCNTLYYIIIIYYVCLRRR